ncbi:MAG TPA: hypothetical protein VLQ68_09765, partial [Rhizobiaceae bacterium]|nr:hypothetical protein [Rhizobiaceae bacterium]
MLVPHLGPGGAQKVVTSVAAAWAHSEKKVVLVTCWSRPEVHPVHPTVERINLDFDRYSQEKRRLAARLSRLMVKLGSPLNFQRHKNPGSILRGLERWQVGQIKLVIQRLE